MDTNYGGLIDYGLKQQETGYKYKMYEMGGSIISSAGQMFASNVNYQNIIGNSYNYQTQAEQVLLTAKEQANQLRQQFIQSAGNYMYGAAQRGVDVKSGSVQSNLRTSAENVGKDVQKMEKNAQIQASALRAQASAAKAQAKAQRANMLISGTGSILGSLAMGAGAYGDYLETKDAQALNSLQGTKEYSQVKAIKSWKGY